MVNIGGVEIELSRRDGYVTCGETRLQLPREGGAYVIDDQRVVMCLRVNSAGAADPDFELPERGRNVFSFTPECELEWFVEEPGDAMTPEDYHASLWTVADRVLTQTVEANRMFELDGETGAILDHWPEDVFVHRGIRHSLDDDIRAVTEVTGKPLVYDHDSVLHCFGDDGHQLWELHLIDGGAWQFADRDGQLKMRHVGGRGYDSVFTVDAETGEILEQTTGPEHFGERLRETN